MIEITYKHMVTTPLVQTINKLTQLSVFDGKTAYRIHKINEKLREYYLKSLGEYNILGLTFAKKDEKGETLKDEKGQYVPEDDKKDAFEVELENFLNTKFQIQQMKLNIHTLTARFSPHEIASLVPLLEGLEESEEAGLNLVSNG